MSNLTGEWTKKLPFAYNRGRKKGSCASPRSLIKWKLVFIFHSFLFRIAYWHTRQALLLTSWNKHRNKRYSSVLKQSAPIVITCKHASPLNYICSLIDAISKSWISTLATWLVQIEHSEDTAGNIGILYVTVKACLVNKKRNPIETWKPLGMKQNIFKA